MKSIVFYTLTALNLVACFVYFSSFKNKSSLGDTNFQDKILKVRGIVIVDSLGVERIIVGSHLPEPNFAYGNRVQGRGKRGGVSGVMLYDSEGQERGGYVTDDYYGNAFLTLDSKTAQQFLMIAEPQGAGTLQVWSENGKNKVLMSADDESAAIQLKQNGKNIKLYSDEK